MTMSANQAFATTIPDLKDNSINLGQPIPALSDRELRDFLAPISPEAFFAEYWEQKPLFIKGGLDKVERLFPGGFTTAHLFEAVREAEANQVRGFRLWAQRLKDRNVVLEN